MSSFHESGKYYLFRLVFGNMAMHYGMVRPDDSSLCKTWKSRLFVLSPGMYIGHFLSAWIASGNSNMSVFFLQANSSSSAFAQARLLFKPAKELQGQSALIAGGCDHCKSYDLPLLD